MVARGVQPGWGINTSNTRWPFTCRTAARRRGLPDMPTILSSPSAVICAICFMGTPKRAWHQGRTKEGHNCGGKPGMPLTTRPSGEREISWNCTLEGLVIVLTVWCPGEPANLKGDLGVGLAVGPTMSDPGGGSPLSGRIELDGAVCDWFRGDIINGAACDWSRLSLSCSDGIIIKRRATNVQPTSVRMNQRLAIREVVPI
mmetsp:Transcript_57368/g.105507  ORF Transcript_57368/g.105507 Transcript_57368/m.105507 type:complete len:201 (+) Transcript_57368:446-1048(+)